jgi:hypothetical protein
MAQTQVAAIEQKAIVEIETSCLDAQTQLALVNLALELLNSTDFLFLCRDCQIYR